jgi:hypothetical protein
MGTVTPTGSASPPRSSQEISEVTGLGFSRLDGPGISEENRESLDFASIRGDSSL